MLKHIKMFLMINKAVNMHNNVNEDVKNHTINCMACLVLEHLKNIVFDDYQDSIKES